MLMLLDLLLASAGLAQTLPPKKSSCRKKLL